LLSYSFAFVSLLLGNATSQYFLGVCYRQGTGVQKDEIEALRWIRLAADQNHSEAQYYLGEYHEKGLGLQTSHAAAVSNYSAAAKQGHAQAQLRLGQCYLAGRGCEQSNSLSLAWCQKAAQQGNAEARALCIALLNSGTKPVFIGDAQLTSPDSQRRPKITAGAGASPAKSRSTTNRLTIVL
jgi:TPR repeat protein